MRRWKTWSALLFAVVLSLGMIGVAAADPPDPHPACEKEDPPPGCADDGHPGDPDEDDEDGGEDPGGDENPLAPLGDACSQVVQAIAEGDPTGQAIQLHALCEALGAEPLDDGEEDPEDPGEPGEEESPTQPIADGCNTVIDEMVGGGAPPEVEEGRQLCDQFGDRPDDGEEDPEDPEDPGEEESPTQPIADGCNTVIDEMVGGGAPPDVEQGRQLCDQFGDRPDDGEEDPEDPEDPEEPGDGDEASPLAEGCDQVVDALTGVSEEFEQGRALCEQAP